MIDKADTESRGRDGHLDKISVPATQETVFEHKLDPTFANRDSEAIKVTDSDDEKEIPGALQQIMSRNEQILTHILIWLLVFVLGFSNSVFRVLTPYVVSDYKRHALTATTDVVANIASGIFRLPYANLLDVWGRPQSLSLMVLFTVLGAVMKAGCNSVETYCAAQCFIMSATTAFSSASLSLSPTRHLFATEHFCLESSGPHHSSQHGHMALLQTGF
ncbi:hypothetical protein FVER53590_04405 [Fusarium verticillioides]|nr:hypothetical protein FVER53590_04405 [Fusarium verticillioides]